MVTCNECGASNRADAQFCAQCDAYLAWVETPQEQQEPPPPEVDTDPVPADAAAARTPQVQQPTRPATPRRPAPEQPAARRPSPSDAPPADDPAAGRQVGAVRPAEPKPKVKKQYGSPQARQRATQVALRNANRVVDVPRGMPHPASLRGSLDEARVARGFGREMRAAAGGRRPRYDRSLTTRVLAVRTVLAVIGLLVLVVVLVPSWRTTVRSWGDRQLDRVIPGRFQDLDVASVSVEPAGIEETRGFLPSYAVDGLAARAWAVRSNVEPGAELGPECSAIGVQPTLVARFDAPSQVDRITIRAGLDPESPDRLRQARPRVVDLLLSDNQCLRQNLPDSFEPFAINAPGTQVDSVRMTVVDVYPPQTGEGGMVAISEITFSRR